MFLRQEHCRRRRLAREVVLCLVTLAASTSAVRSALAPDDVNCRVLESHSAETYGMNLVLFHQRDAGDAKRLATLLHQHAGATVQFRTTDGRWHQGTVFRLKGCFGRGLLLFPSPGLKLAEGSEFVIRFSVQQAGISWHLSLARRIR